MIQLNKNILIISALLFFIGLGIQPILAQDLQGEIDEGEIIIRKGKPIKLPPANRNYRKIKIPPPSGMDRDVELEFRKVNVGLSPLDPSIRAKKVKPEPLSKLYGAYVKGGLGNYGTTNLEFYLSNKRSKEAGYGIYVDHLASARGPGDDRDLSGESHNRIGVFGEYALFNSLAFARAEYQRDHVNYYGFNQQSDFSTDTLDLEHNFNRFALDLGIRSYNPGSYWEYEIGLGYNYTGDNFNYSEHLINGVIAASYEIQPGTKGGLDIEGTFSSYGSSSLTYDRNLASFLPYISQDKEKYSFKAGVRIAYESDTLLENDIHFYPSLIFKYHVLPEVLDAYAGVDGSPEILSFNEQTRENPWLGQNVYLGTQNLVLNLFGGVRGNLSKKLWYDLGLKYKTIDRLPMFINDFQDTSRFTILYERGNSSLFQLEAMVSWEVFSKTSLEFEARVNNYSMAEQQRAWHLPLLELKFQGNYLLREKAMLKFGFLFQDGIYVFDSQGNESKLDPITDLGIGVDYFVSNRFTVFADLNNLLGKNYQRYLNYPVKGFNFIAGASYSF